MCNRSTSIFAKNLNSWRFDNEWNHSCCQRDSIVVDPAFEYIDDEYSGSELYRPGLERLRNHIAASLFDRLYVHCSATFRRCILPWANMLLPNSGRKPYDLHINCGCGLARAATVRQTLCLTTASLLSISDSPPKMRSTHCRFMINLVLAQAVIGSFDLFFGRLLVNARYLRWFHRSQHLS